MGGASAYQLPDWTLSPSGRCPSDADYDPSNYTGGGGSVLVYRAQDLVSAVLVRVPEAGHNFSVWTELKSFRSPTNDYPDQLGYRVVRDALPGTVLINARLVIVCGL